MYGGEALRNVSISRQTVTRQIEFAGSMEFPLKNKADNTFFDVGKQKGLRSVKVRKLQAWIGCNGINCRCNGRYYNKKKSDF